MKAPTGSSIVTSRSVVGSKYMFTELVEITPEEARDYLSANTGNRAISNSTVNRYAEDMANGRWKETGETIKIAESGRVLDGQHRLQAIIDSGETQEMLVCFNVAEDAFDVLDTGKRRSAQDVLHIAGMKNCSALAAAVGVCHAIDNDLCSWDSPRSSARLTNQKILELARGKYSGLSDTCEMTYQYVTGARGFLNPTAIIVAHYVLTRKQAASVTDFFEMLTAGINLSRNHPILYARNKLFKYSQDPLVDLRAYRQFCMVMNTYKYFARGAIDRKSYNIQKTYKLEE